MSISVMNRKKRFTGRSRKQQHTSLRAFAYAGTALLCIVTDNVYALFGHGVRSAAMTWMFLYPLAAGAFWLILSALGVKTGNEGWGRLGANALGSGIATLTAGAFLKGILEIAGSSSAFVPVFYTAGWVFTVVGVICTVLQITQRVAVSTVSRH